MLSFNNFFRQDIAVFHKEFHSVNSWFPFFYGDCFIIGRDDFPAGDIVYFVIVKLAGDVQGLFSRIRIDETCVFGDFVDVGVAADLVLHYVFFAVQNQSNGVAISVHFQILIEITR